MKLHEIANPRVTLVAHDVEGVSADFDVNVEYDYVPASTTQHERGDPTTREHHSESLSIIKATTDETIYEIDEDVKKTGKTWPKGTDVRKLPLWSAANDADLLKQLKSSLKHDPY